jgi:hypothetical protein
MNPYQRNQVNMRLAFPDQQLVEGCNQTCGLITELYTTNDDNDCKKKVTMVTYTATGALLGTPLLPPVGTIVGGLIGMSVGLIKTLVNDIVNTRKEILEQRRRNELNHN